MMTDDYAGEGHNSGEVDNENEDESAIVSGQLRSFIERVENSEEEKAEIAAHIREIYAEAKAHGFDTKVMRQVIKIRKMDASDRAEQQSLLDLYLGALGL